MKRSNFGIYQPTHKIALLLADLTLFATSFYLASKYRLQIAPEYLSVEYIGLTAIVVMSLFIGGSYTSSSLSSSPKLPLRTFFIVITASIPSLLFIYLLGPEKFTDLFGRGVFPFAILGFGVLAVVSRLVINRLFQSKSTQNQVLFLGEIDSHKRLEEAISASPFKVEVQHANHISQPSILNQTLSAIVICPDHRPNKTEQAQLIDCRLNGTPIFSLSDFFESFLFLVPVQEINSDWFIRAEGFKMLHSAIAMRVKRVLDILIAASLLVVTLPITILTAALIKLTSRGPIFFTQTRLGIQSKPFTVYKFRTMNTNAELEGAQWATANDPRILPIGGFLRSSRIDELPQCWNILKGEMSLIGPRPERPEFTSQLSKEIPYYDLRHVIKPGLTGWAQVSYPYGASVEDALRKLQYDLYYIKNYSLLLDLNILLRTVSVTISRTGR